ncbi:MAG: hybrid sensory histidine kinase BarA [Methanosaeta sp. PtaU1.Bin060]|nr:MAG: hybrid sensory histidine kinase BarA [Methanosaeta sp. PtaU1.Bin060]
MSRSGSISSDGSEGEAQSCGAPSGRSTGVRPAAPAISFFHAAIVGALSVAFFGIGMFLLRDDPEANTAFTDIATFLIDALVTLALFYAARRSYSGEKRVFYAWLLLAISRLAWTVGDFLWAYTEVVLKESPYPSPSDLFFIISYPLFLAGVLLLPNIKFTTSERLKMALDTGIVLISAALVFWSLIIVPTIEMFIGLDSLTLTLSVAYPVMDLILLFAVLELLFRKIPDSGKNPLMLLAIEIMVLIVTDTIFFRQTVDGTYAAGNLVDLGWPIGYVILGLAGISQADLASRGQANLIENYQHRYGQLTWPLYLPYLSAGCAFALLIWSHDHYVGVSFGSLSLAVAAIICMVIVRQVLALNENADLYHEAQRDLRVREQAEREIVRLNEELERRVIQRTSQLEAANRDLHSEIVERTQAEAAMKDSERRLADIINFLPDATFVVNKDGEVIFWNRAIEKMTGIKAEMMMGKGDHEYALPFYGERRPILVDLVLEGDPDVEKRYDGIKKMEDGTLMGETYVTNMKNGAGYLLGNAAVLYDSEGRVYGAIESISNITERKLAEENMKSAKNRAESAMRAKSEFLANMSHEIRTPMNAVIGMAGLLLESDLKPEQRDYLETIRNSGNALLAIINDILDFSKIDGGKMEIEAEPFDLQSCIEVSFDLLAGRAAEKGLDLAYLINEDVPTHLLGDATRLRQVLVNLLGNAVKFTEKGEVVLYVTASAKEDENVEIRFSVRDTGIGIAAENMDRLFQSFSQVDSSTTRNYGGTGLGLAISKRLVELMGGRIWAESRPGMGSTFHFTIRAKVSKAKETSKEPYHHLREKSVLIVEGNEAVRSMLMTAAGSWGMRAAAASSIETAMDILKGEDFDFVVIDIVQPDEDGLALARERMHGLNPEARIVMVSHLGKEILLDSSVSGRLNKPILPLQLRRLLADLVSPEKSRGDGAVGDIPAAQEMLASTPHILLAEDNPVNQKVALSMLKRLGYKADVASNGQEVLSALERQPYDLILMDIQMPGMDGLETTRAIRERRLQEKQPCIIAMTAYALEGDKEECLRVGMDEYLSKPIKIDELQEVLERSIKKRGA